jgi:L-malate glycosyltransferase
MKNKFYKIVYVLPYTYWGGGLQMNRLTLLQELVKYNDLEITICVLEFSGKTSQLFKELGLEEVFLNSKAKFIYPKTTLALYKLLSKLNPDIVHTGNVDADIHGFLATRFLKNTKLVVEEIGSSVDRKPMMRKIHRFVYERADKVLCVSPDILKDMRTLEGLRRQDVEITYNPVNLNHLSKSFNTVDELKTKHNISEDIFVFGIISRFELFKGHTFLFQAFKKLLKEQPNCVLVVTGDGPLKQNFKKEVTSLGITENVIFTGMIENVGDYLNLFDIFVHPSLKEPFGIAIIEAMYLKKPVISTNVGGPKEYIDHGVSGLLVPPYNIEHLSEAMLQLLSDENYRISLGKNANLVVKNRFLPKQYAKSIYNIYRSI